MKQHAAKHGDLKFQWDICGRVFDDFNYLRQHKQGAHGRGWMTLCGKAVDCPPHKLHWHQSKCDKCKKIKEKLETQNKDYWIK